MVVGNRAFEADQRIAVPIEAIGYRILTETNRSRHRESAGSMARPRAGIPRCPSATAAESAAPLEIERVIGAAALGIVDADDDPASGVARVLDQPDRSPAIGLDEAEIVGIAGQRSVALKSPPRGRLPPGCRQQAHVARHLNFRRVIHADFNRASAVSSASGDGRSPGHGVSMGCRHEYRQNQHRRVSDPRNSFQEIEIVFHCFSSVLILTGAIDRPKRPRELRNKLLRVSSLSWPGLRRG